MGFKVMISDWNGTLYKPETDEVQNKKIAYGVLNNVKRELLLKGKIWKISEIFNLIKAKNELKTLVDNHEHGFDLNLLYAPFNNYVLKNQDPNLIMKIIDDYAKDTSNLVDSNLISLISSYKTKERVILSASIDYSIVKILESAGFQNVFDKIIANRLSVSDNVVRIDIDVNGNKKSIIKNLFFEKRNLSQEDIIYFGDTIDDSPVAEIIIKGNFIVSFFANDNYKQYMAQTYGAFIPNDINDLHKYLKSKSI